jgi:DNA-directed RNA polymerase beta subunit
MSNDHVRSYDHYITEASLQDLAHKAFSPHGMTISNLRFSKIICGRTRYWGYPLDVLYKYILPFAFYSKSSIYVEVEASIQSKRVLLGTIPVMVGSRLLPLPPHELGGYFVVDGRELVLLHFEQSARNVVVTNKGSSLLFDKKHKYTVGVKDGHYPHLVVADIPLRHVFDEYKVDIQSQKNACGLSLLPPSAAFLLNTPSYINCQTIVIPEHLTGGGEETLHLLGTMAFYALANHYELMEDRSFDDIIYKRVMTSGERLYSIVSKCFADMASSKNIRTKNMHIKHHLLSNTWQTLFNTGTYNSKLKGLVVPLPRLNDIATQSMLLKIINSTTQSEASTRVYAPRMLAPRDFGRICPFDTPDSQDKMGLLKTLTTSARITLDADASPFTTLLKSLSGALLPPSRVHVNCFVNGRAVCTIENHQVDDVTDAMQAIKHVDVTVAVVKLSDALDVRELHVLSDAGRIVRLVDGAYMDALEEDQLWKSGASPTCQLADMVGPCTHTVPYWHHDQAPRNVYAAAQMKQAMGAQADSFYNRPYNLVYPQRPLVGDVNSTIGVNAVVAVISDYGNQEDALIVSDRFRDTGGFRSFMHLTNQQLGVPHLEPGAPVNAGQKMRLQNPKTMKHSVQSIKQNGVVDSVVICATQSVMGHELEMGITGTSSIKIFIPPRVGDKLSSRHGQKGTISCFRRAMDMPWNEEGITPDIVFNPHGMPSRLVPGHLKEGISGIETALGHGMKYEGTCTMYSGVTGEEFECKIYMGMIYYLRLWHLADSKLYSNPNPNINLTTLQPERGRSVGGALKIGHMERGVLKSYGVASVIEERNVKPIATTIDKHGNVDVPMEEAVKITQLPGITTRVINDLRALNINCQIKE